MGLRVGTVMRLVVRNVFGLVVVGLGWGRRGRRHVIVGLGCRVLGRGVRRFIVRFGVHMKGLIVGFGVRRKGFFVRRRRGIVCVVRRGRRRRRRRRGCIVGFGVRSAVSGKGLFVLGHGSVVDGREVLPLSAAVSVALVEVRLVLVAEV